MKIERAIIELEKETLTFPEMDIIGLAHLLISYAKPQLEIVIPESKIESFRQEAKRDYMGTTKIFTDFEAYQELYVKIKCNEYIRIEHAKHSYNEAVLAYEAKIKELKELAQ